MTVAIFLGSLLIAMAIGIPIAYSLLLNVEDTRHRTCRHLT